MIKGKIKGNQSAWLPLVSREEIIVKP